MCEECGIVGIYNLPEAATFAYLSSYALQHRGQESAGIVASNGERLYRYAGMGTIKKVFSQEKLKQLVGDSAIAHNRYSTSGASFLRNAQPIRVDSRLGSMALAHNGNLTNELKGVRPSSSDTWFILHNFEGIKNERGVHLKIYQALKNVEGAFSLIFLHKDAKEPQYLSRI